MIRSAPLTNDEAKTILKELGIPEKPLPRKEQRPGAARHDPPAASGDPVVDSLLRELCEGNRL